MKAIAKRCVVVGTGLVGGSLAGALKRSGIVERVCGVGRSRDNLSRALDKKLVDEVSTDLEASLVGADLVVLAAPVDSVLRLMDDVAAAMPAGCVVTDVGSVKVPVVERANNSELATLFVGGHPMAGSEKTGAESADCDLFREKTVVLTPTASTTPETLGLVRSMWEATGARVVEMDAVLHDRLVASSSHLPQLVAWALAAGVSGIEPRTLFLEVVGNGFADTTRLADSDPSVWQGVLDFNRESVLEAMDRFSASWAELHSAIEKSDGGGLEAVVARARSVRRNIGES